MENSLNILEYNTHRERLVMPEYGRGVQKMVNHLKEIPDRVKRSEQAVAVVKSMELLNPSIHTQENWRQTLWDHLFIMADYDLDIDAPYPVPERKAIESAPQIVPVQKKPVKARHYGRNIEGIIDLIAAREDGEVKTAMLKDLAIYMRTQYLIWNKDSVSDRTIFDDIEKLSQGRITVPEGLELDAVSSQTSFSRPGMNVNPGQPSQGKARQNKNRRNRRRK